MDNTIADDELVLLRKELKCKTDEDLLQIWDVLMDPSADRENTILNADKLFQNIITDQRVNRDSAVDEKTDKAPLMVKRGLIAVLSAACLLVALKFGFDFLNRSALPDPEMVDINRGSAILPGGNKARILLADGSEIDLETLTTDTIIHLDGYTLHKTIDGSVTYRANQDEAVQRDIYNTIITPKGGEYRLTMSDGTKVIVNAASTLRYPINFHGQSRIVDLDGEAYFDVSKHHRNGENVPFIVRTDRQMLTVLGTQFNVNSYGKTVETTLVEGAVELSFENGKNHVLKPNQQAIFRKGTSDVEVSIIDPFYVVSWKNGSFAFEDASMYDVMESVARWYDVEVVFKDDLNGKEFSGTISRFEDINKLLKLIELTGSVKFKIEGRRIMVMR